LVLKKISSWLYYRFPVRFWESKRNYLIIELLQIIVMLISLGVIIISHMAGGVDDASYSIYITFLSSLFFSIPIIILALFLLIFRAIKAKSLSDPIEIFILVYIGMVWLSMIFNYLRIQAQPPEPSYIQAYWLSMIFFVSI